MDDRDDARRRSIADDGAIRRSSRTRAPRTRSRPSVRRAIRTELSATTTARGRAADAIPTVPVIELDHVSLAFDRPILEDVSFAARDGRDDRHRRRIGHGKVDDPQAHPAPARARQRARAASTARTSPTSPSRRRSTVRQQMGMVFQSAALFDSMTVFENVAYPLREHTRPRRGRDRGARAGEARSSSISSPIEVMEQLPSELSGGMRKRVGIARGMANNPEIMLYDEPTSGLDPLTTGTITRLIMKLQRELDVTSIVVSHDIRSVFRMATHVALLNERSHRLLRHAGGDGGERRPIHPRLPGRVLSHETRHRSSRGISSRSAG